MAWNGSDRSAEQKKSGDTDRPRWGGRHSPRWGGRYGWWIAIGAVVVLAGGIWLATGTGGGDGELKAGRKIARGDSTASAMSPQQAVGAAMAGMQVTPGKKRARRVNVEMFAHLSGEDRRMAEQVQSALDADDLKATIAAASESFSSTNVEVRMNAVDALGWFGSPALPELARAMADEDEEIRQAAENHFEFALQEIERPKDRLKIALAAFKTLADEDQLASLGGIIDITASEFIDGENDVDEAAENRFVVIQELVYIIDGGRPKNVEAAKEVYNSITGNEWLGVEEAERYLADPENYEPADEAEKTEAPEKVEESTVEPEKVEESTVEPEKVEEPTTEPEPEKVEEPEPEPEKVEEPEPEPEKVEEPETEKVEEPA